MRTSTTWMAVCGLLLTGMAPGWAQGGAAAAAGKPQQLQFDLRRFEELSTLSPVDRAKRGIAYLKEEVSNPSRSLTAGSGVGVIDHDSILATMAMLLAEHEPDLQTLRAEYGRIAAGELKDAVAVVLGLMGERAVLPHLATFFGNPANPPNLRVAAAKALAKMPDARVVPYAANVVARDGATRVAYKHNPHTNAVEAKVQQFFVRGAALVVLKAIKSEGIDVGAEVRRLMENSVIEITLPAKPGS